jgi:uncharacterized membrane protein YvbJ
VKLCPQCGHRLQDGFQLCPFDGTEVVDAAKAIEKSNWTETQKLNNAAKPTSLSSARMRRTTHSTWQQYMPLMLAAVATIVLLAIGAFIATNMNADTKKVEPTLEEMVQNGNLVDVITILERRKKNGTMIAKEHEMLNKLYLQQALKLKEQGKIDLSIDLLKKVPARSDVYSQSTKLANQLKKKHTD